MPSAITSKLCNEEQTFEEFVWRCSRGMAFMMHMRDEPLDAPIKKPSSSFSSLDYHQKGIL